jgi:hypothetical protein
LAALAISIQKEKQVIGKSSIFNENLIDSIYTFICGRAVL